jgi:predicted amidohydrolase YtcJ
MHNEKLHGPDGCESGLVPGPAPEDQMRKTARIPLLKDHHTHPYFFAALASCLDISSVTVKKEAVTRITERFESEDFVIVTGWCDSRFGFANEEFDSHPPLLVFNISFHALMMNAAARERLAGLFPQVVKNYRSGGWVERHAPLVVDCLLKVKPCGLDGLRSFFAGLAKQGVWYAEEMFLQGGVEVGLFGKASLIERTRFWANPVVFASLADDARSHVHGIKLFTDGAVGARTALLEDRYLTGQEGVKVWSDEELGGLVEAASRTGKSLAVHAIGDAAIDQILRVLDRMPELQRAFPEIRIEHCQFISRQAALKAKSMGIILCLQPNFSLDSTCYADRLPESYRLRNNPLRMLIDEAGYVPGKDLVFGSDGMPHGARAALEGALFPPLPCQKLTLEELVAGYCMPDFRNGYIDVSIDYEGRTVDLEVVLAGEGGKSAS